MKRIVMIAISALLCLPLFAQPQGKGTGGGLRGDRKAEYEHFAAQKVAYITDKLSFTPAESEKFWPLYNQYWAKNMEIGRDKRRLYKKISDETATDADLAAIVKLAQSEADLVEQYAKIFATVIPVSKVAKFFVEQENFKVFLMRNAMKR